MKRICACTEKGGENYMDNILKETVGDIKKELSKLNISLDSCAEDLIRSILAMSFNRVFQEGTSFALKHITATLGQRPIKRSNGE